MMGINVLSCFDGISCGQLALQRAGIRVDNYFASEIDKYAIKITQKNFPNTVQLGDILNWKSWDLPKIDLLIAGSPCQGFSNAGLGLNFEDPRSKLFFTFCDILAVYYGKNRDMKYLLENVKMKKEWRAIITDYMKVEPVLINSALLSAQNRERLYWANWEFGQPEDKGIYLKDIVQSDDEIEERYVYSRNHAGTVKKLDQKAGCFTAGAHSGGNHSDMTLLIYPQDAAIRNQVTKRGVEEQLNVRKDGKSSCVVPSYPRKLNGVVVALTETRTDEAKKIRREHKKATGKDWCPRRGKKLVPRTDGKANCITAGITKEHTILDDCDYRKLTPLECERLQTMPENWTSGISNTQRYKCIGNGWTVDVVAHIFSHLKEFYTV